HSLKGGARAVAQPEIARLIHAAEGAVLALHGQPDRLTRALCDALFATVDALLPVHDGSRADAARLIETLQALPGAAATDPAPTLAPAAEPASPAPTLSPASAPAHTIPPSPAAQPKSPGRVDKAA